jgi:hypothetical protein
MQEKTNRNKEIYKKKLGIGCKKHTYRQLSIEYDLSITALQNIVRNIKVKKILKTK